MNVIFASCLRTRPRHWYQISVGINSPARSEPKWHHSISKSSFSIREPPFRNERIIINRLIFKAYTLWKYTRCSYSIRFALSRPNSPFVWLSSSLLFSISAPSFSSALSRWSKPSTRLSVRTRPWLTSSTRTTTKAHRRIDTNDTAVLAFDGDFPSCSPMVTLAQLLRCWDVYGRAACNEYRFQQREGKHKTSCVSWARPRVRPAQFTTRSIGTESGNGLFLLLLPLWPSCQNDLHKLHLSFFFYIQSPARRQAYYLLRFLGSTRSNKW